MRTSYALRALSLIGLFSLFFCPTVSADTVELIERHLQAGTLADGEAALQKHLAGQPQDDQARFGLGTIQFLRGIEGLSQAWYRHGLLQSRFITVTLLRDFPLPENPNPETINYAQLRAIFEKFAADLQRAEATLAGVKSADVKLPLHFGLIRLDLNGDGQATEDERLWRVYAELARAGQIPEETAKQFVISFDRGDQLWLQGYCHVLLAITDVYLAYDGRELFERAGHVLFPKVESPYPFLLENQRPEPFSWPQIVDVIAYIHLLNFPLAEPKRMSSAHQHLLQVIALSRQSWQAIQAETDNDHEWVPNPKQTGVIPNVRVSQEMIDSWHAFLDESELILQGKKLIPFWRGQPGRGLNLQKVFLEPKPFDLVLWVQGTGAAPYLADGPLTDPAIWRRQQQVFRGQFFGFAVWFN